MKRKMRKYLPLVLAVIAVLQLLSAWAKFSGDEVFTDPVSPFYSDKESVYGIQNDPDVRARIEYQKQIGEKIGIEFKTEDVLKLVQYFYDGKLSPEELDYTAGIVNPIIKQVVRYYDEEVFGVDQLEEDAEVLGTLRTLLGLYHIVYLLSWIIFFAYLANFFLKKFNIVKLLFFVIMAVNAALFIFITVYLNNNLNDVDYFLETTLTLRPFLTLIFALPDTVYMPFIKKMMADPDMANFLNGTGKALKKSAEALHMNDLKNTITDTFMPGENEPVTTAGWTCPNCGMENSSDSRFCSGCGKPNPFIAKCPKCGKELRNKEKFCPDCGSPIFWPSTGVRCPNCGMVNTLDSYFCENCGTQLKKSKIDQQ